MRRISNTSSAPRSPNAAPVKASDQAIRFLFPGQPSAFRDHIANHTSGTRFQGARVKQVQKYDPSKGQEIFNALAQDNIIKEISLDVTKGVVALTHTSTAFELSQVSGVTRVGKFLGIMAVLIRFQPLLPTFHEAVPVSISLVDKGLPDSNVHPTVKFNKTFTANVILGLNYSVPLDRIKDIYLRIVTGSTNMEKGRAWGTIEMHVVAQASTKPVLMSMTESLVQYELPSDILEVSSTDPRVYHAVLEQEDLEALKGIISDVAGSPTSIAGFRTPVQVKPKEATAFNADWTLRTEHLVEAPSQPEVFDPSELDDDTIEAAAEQMRSLGFVVTRPGRPEISRPYRLGRQPSIASSVASGSRGFEMPLVRKTTGLLETIQVLAPTFEIPRGLTGLDLPDEQSRQLMTASRGAFVYIAYNDLGEVQEISTHEFPGGIKMPLSTLAAIGKTTKFLQL